MQTDTTTINPVDLPELHNDGNTSSEHLGERLDLVEHLGVNLTVSLGSASMTVAELFSLRAGDIIDLDREADSPVDIHLNNRIVGRGHLVSVGEMFGIRISEINTG